MWTVRHKHCLYCVVWSLAFALAFNLLHQNIRRPSGSTHKHVDNTERHGLQGPINRLENRISQDIAPGVAPDIAPDIATGIASDMAPDIPDESVFDEPGFPYLRNFKNPCWIDANSPPQEVTCVDGGASRGPVPRMRCLPYFYVIGIAKCGTTDIYKRLVDHPDIYDSGKEHRFWCGPQARPCREKFKADGGICGEAASKTPAFPEYVERFDDLANCIQVYNETDVTKTRRLITGDFSPCTSFRSDLYAWFPEEPVNGRWSGEGKPKFVNPRYLKNLLPDVKIVIILRNPVERMYSAYMFHGGHDISPETFHNVAVRSLEITEGCLKEYTARNCLYNISFYTDLDKRDYGLRLGMYSVFLMDWLAVFPRQQIHIVRTEDYARDLSGALDKIYAFLGLEPLTSDVVDAIVGGKVHNERRPHYASLGDMLPKTRTMLNDFYAPYNRDLADLLRDDRFLWQDTT